MKLLISGYYGSGNVGDEAVLEAIVQGIKKRIPGAEITVISAAPLLTREINAVAAIHRFDWINIVKEVRGADILISGGGTLFQDVTSTRSFLYYIGIILLAKLFRKKVVVFAQGFGPLRGRINQRIARFALNRADLITMRDEKAFIDLCRAGIKKPPAYITADPSFLLEVSHPAEGLKVLSLEGIPLDRPLVGVSVRTFRRRPQLEKVILRELAEALDFLSQKYSYRPVFLLLHCPEDMAEASKVIARMREDSNIVFRICRPDEMLALISRLDLLIGMRLHSLIFAALNSVPMLGLSYDPKVEAFMNIINQPCLKADEGLKVGTIESALEDIIRRKAAIKDLLNREKKMLAESAAANFDLFLKNFGKNS